jgi:hypothetical protein
VTTNPTQFAQRFTSAAALRDTKAKGVAVKEVA